MNNVNRLTQLQKECGLVRSVRRPARSVQGEGQVGVLGGDGEGGGGLAERSEDAGEFAQGQGGGVAFAAEVGENDVAE